MTSAIVVRLRHFLRTPLNHIVGYAEMLRDEANEHGDGSGAALMSDIIASGKRILEAVQAALPPDNRVLDNPLPGLGEGMSVLLERILGNAQAYDDRTAGASAADIARIRSAAVDLLSFARGGHLPEPHFQIRERPNTIQGRHTAGRILVVDDDEANREILCRRLDRERFAVAQAADGAEALECIRREHYDLVLLDIFMPEMDGFQVLTTLKSDPKLRNVPVIVLSALDDVENAVRSMEMGAEDFLAKPYEPILLRARIGAILRRREVERERTELAENLRLILESTGEGVFGADRDGKCMFVNRAAAEMLGHSRDALLGRDLHALIHHSRPDGSPYPEPECPMMNVLRTGEARQSGEELLFRADGSSFPVDFSAHPIRREGEVDGIVVTFADISERKRAEAHLLQAAKLESLGVLAGGLAHDFNNILTGILGNASLALDSLAETDENRGLLLEVVRSSERAADLTRQMLAFAGKGQFVIEDVDLSEAVEEIRELLEASLPKAAHLDLQLTRHLPAVPADRQQIQQMIFNLVANAGEAIGDRQGTVTLSTGIRRLPGSAPPGSTFEQLSPGIYVCLSVADTGEGMDESTRARIFDPFFSTKFTGRGLGLPAVMGIVRSHHGAIRVETEKGRGSTFEIALPGKEAALPAAKTAPASPTVLVVDDEEIVRSTTRAVLERKGFHVLLAENGQRAVELFREHAGDVRLVLLDLTMPVMGGEEAARYMHTIRHDVPILVSSGYNESEVARRFTGSRVAGFVRKPYTAATLLQRIGEVMPE